MGRDNFGKCSTCHHFSEVFQCVINRRRYTNSRIFRRNDFKIGKYRANISQA